MNNELCSWRIVLYENRSDNECCYTNYVFFQLWRQKCIPLARYIHRTNDRKTRTRTEDDKYEVHKGRETKGLDEEPYSEEHVQGWEDRCCWFGGIAAELCTILSRRRHGDSIYGHLSQRRCNRSAREMDLGHSEETGEGPRAPQN